MVVSTKLFGEPQSVGDLVYRFGGFFTKITCAAGKVRLQAAYHFWGFVVYMGGDLGLETGALCTLEYQSMNSITCPVPGGTGVLAALSRFT